MCVCKGASKSLGTGPLPITIKDKIVTDKMIKLAFVRLNVSKRKTTQRRINIKTIVMMTSLAEQLFL
jgi:hypothetical protein